MATTKTISTRISNKVDGYTNWVKADPVLLPGEIAIVKVTEQKVNPDTGNVVDVPAILMKVGESGKNFSQLPWLSAKASDVYDWAKSESPGDITIKVKTSQNSEKDDTLVNWLTSIYGTSVAAAANYASLNTAIQQLNGIDSVTGSVANKIKTAIEALDSTTQGQGTGGIVRAVGQTNGKVTVTMGSLSEDDLPATISASKIALSDNTKLDTKLSGIDSDIADLKGKQAGHTDAQINTLITNKLAALDSTSSGEGSFITNVTQTDGKVAVTKGSLPAASDSIAGVVKLGVAGGAATYDAVDDLTDRVEANESDIADLKTATAGGVHFIGVATTNISDNSTAQLIEIEGKGSVTVNLGDVVLYGSKEFIWTGAKGWKELGDLTRVGTLETRIDNLSYTDPNYAANKVVTKVTQTAGKIEVTHASLTSSQIGHDNSTVADVLTEQGSRISATEEELSNVDGAISSAITEALDGLACREPIASGTADAFVTTVLQENGVVTATKASLPAASSSVAGITKLGTQGGAADYDRVEEVASQVTSVDSRLANLEPMSVVYNSSSEKLYVGLDGEDELIFDCGGARLT